MRPLPRDTWRNQISTGTTIPRMLRAWSLPASSSVVVTMLNDGSNSDGKSLVTNCHARSLLTVLTLRPQSLITGLFWSCFSCPRYTAMQLGWIFHLPIRNGWSAWEISRLHTVALMVLFLFGVMLMMGEPCPWADSPSMITATLLACSHRGLRSEERRVG